MSHSAGFVRDTKGRVLPPQYAKKPKLPNHSKPLEREASVYGASFMPGGFRSHVKTPSHNPSDPLRAPENSSEDRRARRKRPSSEGSQYPSDVHNLKHLPPPPPRFLHDDATGESQSDIDWPCDEQTFMKKVMANGPLDDADKLLLQELHYLFVEKEVREEVIRGDELMQRVIAETPQRLEEIEQHDREFWRRCAEEEEEMELENWRRAEEERKKMELEAAERVKQERLDAARLEEYRKVEEDWHRQDEARRNQEQAHRNSNERGVDARRLRQEEMARQRQAKIRAAATSSLEARDVAFYEVKWEVLQDRSITIPSVEIPAPIEYRDFPWPVFKPWSVYSPGSITYDAVFKFVMHSLRLGVKHPLRMIREELQRWHSDKFPRYLERVRMEDRQLVSDTADVVARHLTDMLAQCANMKRQRDNQER